MIPVRHIVVVVSLLLLLILNACATNDTGQSANETNPSILRTSTNHKQEPSNYAKELILEEHEVNEVIAINNDKVIIIAVDPKHHDRLQLKELKNNLKDSVESAFNKHEIELSTDQKIILELRKLEEQLVNGDLSKAELNKELERIRKLSKEQT